MYDVVIIVSCRSVLPSRVGEPLNLFEGEGSTTVGASYRSSPLQYFLSVRTGGFRRRVAKKKWVKSSLGDRLIVSFFLEKNRFVIFYDACLRIVFFRRSVFSGCVGAQYELRSFLIKRAESRRVGDIDTPPPTNHFSTCPSDTFSRRSCDLSPCFVSKIDLIYVVVTCPFSH